MLRRQPKHHPLSEILALKTKLKRQSGLSTLLQQAESHGSLEQTILQAIPHDIRQAFKLANLEAGTLQLQCHTAAMATRLRMRQRDILQCLNRTLPDQINRIQILIRPATATSRKTHRALRLSKENAQTLLQEAGQTSDDGLRAILEKLARHAKD